MTKIQTLSDMNHVHLAALKIILDDIRTVTLIALAVGITNMVMVAYLLRSLP
jgi:hypothetical protein